MTKSELKEMIRECLREELAKESMTEGIFGNKYKGKTILAFRGNGKDQAIAIGDLNGDNLINFQKAHAKKNSNDESDYQTVAATDKAVKKYKKDLKTIPDVSKSLPYWVQSFLDDEKEARDSEFRANRAKEDAEKEQRFKDDAKKAEQQRLSKIKGSKVSNTGKAGVHYSGGDYYSEELEEDAFNGGVAGDSQIGGGKVRGIGASTQPDHKSYLGRLKAKNPDLVDTMTVKGKDIKPGMMTQAGQVKEVEVGKNGKTDKVYIMHTNDYDGFWGVDEDMIVMVDPEDKSKPFTGDYKELLNKGLEESLTEDNIFEGLF